MSFINNIRHLSIAVLYHEFTIISNYKINIIFLFVTYGTKKKFLPCL